MKKQRQKKSISELKVAIGAAKSSFVYAGFFSLFINLLMLVPPLYMLQLYDRVLTSRSFDTLLMLTLIVVILFITMGALEIIRSKMLVVISNKIDAKLSERIFDAMFSLANKFPGKASSQATADLNQLKQYLTGNGIFAFFDAPWLPIYILILFIFHPIFGYFAIFAAIMLFSLALINEYATKNGLNASNDMHRKEQRFIDANIRNSEVIHAMGMLPNIKRQWNSKHQEFLSTHTSASNKAGVWANVSKTSRVAFQSLMLGIGAYLAINMEVTPGMMIAGSIIMGRALAPLDILINSWRNFSGAKQSYYRLEEFLSEFPENEAPMPLPDPKGNLTLEQITVVPPGAKQPALMGVTMDIKAGEIVGVIGPSAAGKSTFARAIMGVWPLYAGKVRIDKADINQWERSALGKFIGYLPQDIELFEGTISQNIARFEEVDPKSVVDAAQLAGVHEMILQLPDGYDTIIGAGGVSLSGGQRQRIGLARAVYNYPKLIVLDEPNSNLDEQGEQALLVAIKALKSANTTVVIITHRPSILQAVDKVALLQQGKLIRYGTKEEIFETKKPTQGEIAQRKPVTGISLTSPGKS